MNPELIIDISIITLLFTEVELLGMAIALNLLPARKWLQSPNA